MARNGSGVYSLPNGYEAATGQTATASQHNTPLVDLEADANTARPVVAGGTGATTAGGARTNLGLGSIATQDADSVNIDGGAIDGTPIGGTTPAAVVATRFYTGEVTIADDDFDTITPPTKGGFMFVSCDPDDANALGIQSGLVYFDVGSGGAGGNKFAGGSLFTFTASALNGTTGTDTHTTIGVATDTIYIENRGGSEQTYRYTIIG